MGEEEGRGEGRGEACLTCTSAQCSLSIAHASFESASCQANNQPGFVPRVSVFSGDSKCVQPAWKELIYSKKTNLCPSRDQNFPGNILLREEQGPKRGTSQGRHLSLRKSVYMDAEDFSDDLTHRDGSSMARTTQ